MTRQRLTMSVRRLVALVGLAGVVLAIVVGIIRLKRWSESCAGLAIAHADAARLVAREAARVEEWSVFLRSLGDECRRLADEDAPLRSDWLVRARAQDRMADFHATRADGFRRIAAHHDLLAARYLRASSRPWEPLPPEPPAPPEPVQALLPIETLAPGSGPETWFRRDPRWWLRREGLIRGS